MRNEDAYYEDDDLVVPDGGSVRVSMQLMDGVQRQIAFDPNHHRPHYAELTDELRQRRAATRDAYVRDLTNAWRSPAGGRKASDTVPSFADADPLRRRAAAYDAYVQRLSNAWRDQEPDDDPDDDPSEPANAVEQQVERWQGRDPVDVARAVERRRRATHAEFSQRLSNAWRAR